MNDPSRPSLLERLSALIMREPGDRDQLLHLLRSAYSRNLLDADAMSIIEGALTVSEMQVRDIMIPRAQVDFIDINEPVETFIPQVMATAHSRFPVIDQNKDDVIGVLLAKDLLRHYAGEEEFNVREMLRPAVFVPEAKRLNVLLREFRASRNHMAIVVDEYGGVAGLVTIEDLVEEIVGEIRDEYEKPEIVREGERSYVVSGGMDVDRLDELFGVKLEGRESATIAGLVSELAGRIPRKGEVIEEDGLRFEVVESTDRRVERVRITAVQPQQLKLI